jgi:hypothetical protein
MLCNIKLKSSYRLLDAGKTDLSPPRSAALVVVRVGFASPDMDVAVVIGIVNSGKGIMKYFSMLLVSFLSW